MTDNHASQFMDLPRKTLEADPIQPRDRSNEDKELTRLKSSIRDLGIQQPIAVVRLGKNRYQIIDGHRRFRCAEQLNLETVPCRVYSRLEPAELERVRFELQNNRRLWKPFERAVALQNYKNFSGDASNKEMAEKLFISEATLSNSLKLGSLKTEFQNLMKEYGLASSYQIEFTKLHPKLRQIDEYTVDEIIRSLFERVQHQIIRTSKDFRIIGRVFLRAAANHNDIRAFLSDPDMTVKQLEEATSRSSFSLLLEEAVKKIKESKRGDISFSDDEKGQLNELRKALLESTTGSKKTIPRNHMKEHQED